MHAMGASERLDAPPVSYEQWQRWPETNTPCEVVDGYAIVTPSPAGAHQLVVSRLLRVLAAGVPSTHEVLVSPADWVLRRRPLLVRQPDLVVVTAEQARAVPLTEAPLLAVEVLSPYNREVDLVTKQAQYAEAGLAWYWLVDPDLPQVAVMRNTGTVFAHVDAAVGDETLSVEEPFPARLRPSDLEP